MARKEIPGSGDVFSTEILPSLERKYEDYIAKARRVARELGKGGREVTIDDVRAACPPPPEMEPRALGAIFRSTIKGEGRVWTNVGHRISARKTCHNRPIAVWRLASAA